MARHAQQTLFLPAGPQFRLQKEVKNVVTVIAKTCHYWFEHTPEDQQQSINAQFTEVPAGAELLEPASTAEVFAEPVAYRDSPTNVPGDFSTLEPDVFHRPVCRLDGGRMSKRTESGVDDSRDDCRKHSRAERRRTGFPTGKPEVCNGRAVRENRPHVHRFVSPQRRRQDLIWRSPSPLLAKEGNLRQSRRRGGRSPPRRCSASDHPGAPSLEAAPYRACASRPLFNSW